MTKHVCSSTFTHKGRQVTVTLVDPEIAPDGTRYPGSPSCSWRSVEPNGMLPVPTDGVMVPATYRVTGLEHDLTVTTRHGRWDDAPQYHGVQIDTVTVHWTGSRSRHANCAHTWGAQPGFAVSGSRRVASGRKHRA
jgi:hypothetical protein